ncbi:histidine phosphatase family protein [Campylobacter sp. LR291e]|uniref:SixA phosphatase family protein n=1 Tax=unclassified Campylobacter TaxID=2593542 RepID=UPI001237E7C5|nr:MULTISPECIES: histidine phosphatase family protein [unclassified Campylobacter]KAA6224880.1 histidine phosphatase family protein [Campylobacter sp. LR185c]KAA6230264.1 histidine phosphatase family protein [Campylobacter sp. LR291e]KAA8604201.1 phosphoglycerate mutase [Campylobacter sp. LR185c]
MKKIYLLRHAKAEKNAICDDFDRKITQEGKEDLKRLAFRLKNYDIRLDSIISSSSKRTKMTAKRFAKAVGFDSENIIYKDELYLASTNEIFTILQALSDDITEVAVVGHNPGICELIEFLSPLCVENFATSAFLCLEFDIVSFNELSKDSGRVVFFENVRELKA